MVGFAFTELLGFRLLPRLKNIGAIRLYRPDNRPDGSETDDGAAEADAQLGPVLTRPIRWDLIGQQYDQMVKYATALRLGTAEAESILRREIHAGLQVVENWNSGNGVVFYGKDGDLTGPDSETAETSMLALHLLQSALVHVNTLLLQRVLEAPGWADLLGEQDRRGLSPLFWTHINPYGRFRLDMDTHLDLAQPATTRA